MGSSGSKPDVEVTEDETAFFAQRGAPVQVSPWPPERTRAGPLVYTSTIFIVIHPQLTESLLLIAVRAVLRESDQPFVGYIAAFDRRQRLVISSTNS